MSLGNRPWHDMFLGNWLWLGLAVRNRICCTAVSPFTASSLPAAAAPVGPRTPEMVVEPAARVVDVFRIDDEDVFVLLAATVELMLGKCAGRLLRMCCRWFCCNCAA